MGLYSVVKHQKHYAYLSAAFAYRCYLLSFQFWMFRRLLSPNRLYLQAPFSNFEIGCCVAQAPSKGIVVRSDNNLFQNFK